MGKTRRLWRYLLVAPALLAMQFLAVVPVSANPDPPAWSSFKDAAFSGIYLTPGLATNTLNYTLSINSTPKITIGTTTYDVNWIQAYFVVAKAENQTAFTATNGTVVTDWTWEVKPTPGQIAGWTGTGGNRINPGDSKALGFAAFNIDGSPVVSGMHIGYQTTGGEVTDWFRGDLPSVPEPGSVVALLCGMAGLAFRRRK